MSQAGNDSNNLTKCNSVYVLSQLILELSEEFEIMLVTKVLLFCKVNMKHAGF